MAFICLASAANEHLNVPKFLGLLVVILAVAKICGYLAKLMRQPAVLGELLAGVLLGMSVAGIVDPANHFLHLLGEIGVIVLLFSIGLETDLKKLVQVGVASTLVAIVGVALPFVLGYFSCKFLGLSNIVGIVVGASLTATSVGITARVLSDLRRLEEPESQIILGAAVIDDVIGLIILAVVTSVTQGKEVTPSSVALTTAIAFGFLVVTIIVGQLIVPPLAKAVDRLELSGGRIVFAVCLAFGLAWLASVAGSAIIIGAFVAGILIRATPQGREIEHGIAQLGHFFVPIFFVVVGAAVDVTVFNPFVAANHRTLFIGGTLVVIALIGKFLAGYAPFWFKGNKKVIGIGMIPRGEVGLIFAQMGLSSGVFDLPLFSAITMMVMVTTFVAPPLLRKFFPPRLANQLNTDDELDAIEEMVNDP